MEGKKCSRNQTRSPSVGPLFHPGLVTTCNTKLGVVGGMDEILHGRCIADLGFPGCLCKQSTGNGLVVLWISQALH